MDIVGWFLVIEWTLVWFCIIIGKGCFPILLVMSRLAPLKNKSFFRKKIKKIDGDAKLDLQSFF